MTRVLRFIWIAALVVATAGIFCIGVQRANAFDLPPADTPSVPEAPTAEETPELDLPSADELEAPGRDLPEVDTLKLEAGLGFASRDLKVNGDTLLNQEIRPGVIFGAEWMPCADPKRSWCPGFLKDFALAARMSKVFSRISFEHMTDLNGLQSRELETSYGRFDIDGKYRFGLGGLDLTGVLGVGWVDYLIEPNEVNDGTRYRFLKLGVDGSIPVTDWLSGEVGVAYMPFTEMIDNSLEQFGTGGSTFGLSGQLGLRAELSDAWDLVTSANLTWFNSDISGQGRLTDNVNEVDDLFIEMLIYAGYSF